MLFFLALLLLSRDSLAEDRFPYTLQWKRLTHSPATALAWRDSLVFIGTGDGMLEAVRQADGVRCWQRRGYGPLVQSLALVDEYLLLADAWGRVEALTQDRGTPLWSAPRLGWGAAELVAQGGLCYLGSADGWLYALYLADGSQRWRLYTGTHLPSRPQMAPGRLYTGGRSGQLVEVDALSGERLRQAQTGSPVVAGPVEARGRLVVGGADGYVRAFRQQGLGRLWQQRLGAPLLAAPLLAADRLVCLAGNGWVYGLDPEEGKVEWKRSLEDKASGPLVQGTEGEILAATEKGRVLALDPRTGRLLWDQQLLETQGLYLYSAGNWLYAGAGDGYLYAFARDLPAAPLPACKWEDWWEVLDLGHKMGYAHQVARADSFQGIDALNLLEETVSWGGGFVRQQREAWVDRAYQPLALVERRIEERQVLETRGVWEGGKVHLEQQLGNRVISREAVAEPGAVLPGAALLKLAQEGRAQKGRQDSIRVFDPTTASTGTLYVSFEGVEGEEDLLEARLRAAAGGLEVVRWIDPQGRQLRSLVPLLGTAQVRVSADQARAWALPGPPKQIYLDHPVKTPARVERLVLELPSLLLASLVVQDERQQVVEGLDHQLRLVVEQRPYGGQGAADLPIQEPQLAPFLQSTLYVQADDPRIQELALQVRGAERDAWRVALRLQQWVADRMIPAETNVRFQSAVEVLEEMEGTCSEYTVLFLSLCRAAGLPARACAGFVASPAGILIPHLWAQVYVGRWVEMDPSWDQAELDAAHLELSQGELSPAELGQLNGPVELFLACADTLRVVEYATEEGRFLGQAERLFAEAEQAERAFGDSLAQGLYQQITHLPWNLRSGEACVRIGRFLLQQGRLPEAEQVFKQLLEMDEKEAAQALFYLGRVAQQQGEGMAAAKWLEQVVEKYPDHDLADEALGQLAQLRQQSGGCPAAIPYYERLCEEYSQSGWALVAHSALERCRQQERAPGDSVTTKK